MYTLALDYASIPLELVYVCSACACTNVVNVLFLLCFTENPIQIFCEHYQFLMQHMNPSEISRMSVLKNSTELSFLLSKAPINYMKNCSIFEQIRILDIPNLFSFLIKLEKAEGQKHISEILLNGTLYCMHCM